MSDRGVNKILRCTLPQFRFLRKGVSPPRTRLIFLGICSNASDCSCIRAYPHPFYWIRDIFVELPRRKKNPHRSWIDDPLRPVADRSKISVWESEEWKSCQTINVWSIMICIYSIDKLWSIVLWSIIFYCPESNHIFIISFIAKAKVVRLFFWVIVTFFNAKKSWETRCQPLSIWRHPN